MYLDTLLNDIHLDTPSSEACTSDNKNHSMPYGSNGLYQGIPDNLGLNVLVWLILLISFAMLRKRAWNYGRIALVQKTEERWTQVFYGTLDEAGEARENQETAASPVESAVHLDKGFFNWLWAVFKIKDRHILNKCGPDAVQYLTFQRYIIVFVGILTIISIVVVLPINFQGNREGNYTSFGHTTLNNLDPDSSLLWIHVTLAILYLPLGIFIMRKFSVNLKFTEEDQQVSRTLMITNIPRRNCDKDDLLRHFKEAYIDVDIQDLQLAFDITKVSNLERKRSEAFESKVYCEDHLKKTGNRLEMRPYIGGTFCSCCNVFGCPVVDALEYYVEEESRLRDMVETEKAIALKKCLGIAFVTFASLDTAKMVFRHHHSPYLCGTDPPSSSLSPMLKPYRWHVTFAPSPRDIYWENLALPSKYWYLKAVTINFFLFLVLFFLTTPAIVVNLLNTDKIILNEEIKKVSPILSEFIPTLMMWTVAALLPVLVSYSDQWLNHWTRSERNHSIMIKTFAFLLFMVLILPSLGLASAEAFVKWFIHPNGNKTYRWECLFLPDKGAFFVNYVTTSAFIGSALELIRFPELFVYVVHLLLAKSKAETANVRKAILYEFPFGTQYAWMLLIFAMTVMYSLSCPLITPFGLVYMILKHLVDKHNIYFAYGPSIITKQIHATAINIVIISIVLLQASFLALLTVRKGLNDITIYALVGFVLTVLLFALHWMFHCCRGFSPIAYQSRSPDSSTTTTPRREFNVPNQFVPQVLQPESPSNGPRRGAGFCQTSPEVSTIHSVAEDLGQLQRACASSSGDLIVAISQPSSNSGSASNVKNHDKVVLYQDYDGA